MNRSDQQEHILDSLDTNAMQLRREWRITIQCPTGGTDGLIQALGQNLPLTQGAYDHCLYLRRSGEQQFRAREGSHAGDEGTIQATSSNEIVFTLPTDIQVLKNMFDLVFEFGVQEEPTIQIDEIWSSFSKYAEDKDNPNRYWNRPDAAELHGLATPVSGTDKPGVDES